MGAATQHQVPVGPASQHDQDSLQVGGTSQQTASHTQSGQPSYVPPHPNIQATQTFFDSEPASAPPAPAVQGYSVGAINTTQPLHCPAQQVQLDMLSQPNNLTFHIMLDSSLWNEGVSSVFGSYSWPLPHFATLRSLQLPGQLNHQAGVIKLHLTCTATACVLLIGTIMITGLPYDHPAFRITLMRHCC